MPLLTIKIHLLTTSKKEVPRDAFQQSSTVFFSTKCGNGCVCNIESGKKRLKCDVFVEILYNSYGNCLYLSIVEFYGRYGDLIQLLQYEVSLSRMLNDILTLDQQ